MLTNFSFLDLGVPELIIILVIILLLFGSKKLPQLSKSIGESKKELKKSLGDSNDSQVSEASKSEEADPKENKTDQNS